jgi:hypothetical protein
LPSNKLLLLTAFAVATADAQLLPPIQISPARIAADSNPTVVAVFGSGFSSGMTVEWNQQARPTTFVDASELQVTLPVSDLALPSLDELSVWDASGSTQITSSAAVLVYLPILNNALAYDATRNVIYIAVSAKQVPQGQSIGVLNPETGIVEAFHTLDSEPLRLALSGDGQYLYVALSNKVRRINLSTWTTEVDIPLGTSSINLPYQVLSMTAVPNQPQSIAVSVTEGGDPPYGGTIVFDGAQPRGTKAGDFMGASYLLGGPNSTTLYGSDGDGVLYTLALSSGGLTVTNTVVLDSAFGIPVYAGGLVYFPGAAVDPTIPAVVQTYGVEGVVGVFPAANNVLVLASGDVLYNVDLGSYLALVDLTTGARIWTLAVPAMAATSNGIQNDPILTWGTNGVAFRDDTGDYSILESPAIQLFQVNISDSAPSPFLNTTGSIRRRRQGLVTTPEQP